MMKEQVYRLMNNKYQDECKGVYIDNYLGIILAIVMVSVHLCYGCCYFYYDCTNGGKRQYLLWEVKVGSKADWQFNGYIYYYLFPHNMQ